MIHFFISLFFLSGFQSWAEVNKNRTPSGLTVPRMVSLKYTRTNARIGPSKKHPLKWVYHRKGLPVVIIAETQDWRRIRDPSGDESWMHKRVLSQKHSVMSKRDGFLYRNPDTQSKIKAKITPGVIFSLNKCTLKNWCEISSENKISGWVKKEILWGVSPFP